MTWSVGHYGEVIGGTAPEAYVPRMMDQEYTPEDDAGSFLGPGWEEALGAEAFQESPESPANCAIDNRYRVPLIPQEQAYANHVSQENQATTAAGGPSTATPSRQEDRAGGSRREAGSQIPRHVARSKAPPEVGPLLGRC